MIASTVSDIMERNAILATLVSESMPAVRVKRTLTRLPFSERNGERQLMRRVSLMRAAILGFEPALRLLTELYSKGALLATELETRLDTSLVLAVGMLAAAQLCDIDSRAVRITLGGMDFVEDLASEL